MNDKELDKSIKKSFENFIKELATNPEKVFDNDKLQIKYNKVLKEKIKLQSNWNSLRKFVTLKEKPKVFGAKDGKTLELAMKFVFDMVLDKMNELERKDKE